MKKGFTLIELLAVIVILNVIEDARIQSKKRSIDMYSRAIEQSVARYSMNNAGINTGDVVCGSIVIDQNGKVLLADCAVNGSKVDYVVSTPMKNMFSNAGYTSFTSLNLGDKFDTSKVKNMHSLFNSTGETSMVSLRLGNKFQIPDSANDTEFIFWNCGKQEGSMNLSVPSQAVKDKIINLPSGSVPAFWKSNANIIVVE